MLTIGEFAEACNTTVKTIRFYDNTGLLKADYISAKNGYRYYKKTSVAKYLRIAAIKEAGFSLSETRYCLNELDDTAFLAMLDEKIALLEQKKQACLAYKKEYINNMITNNRYTLKIDKATQKISISENGKEFSFFADASIIDKIATELSYILNMPDPNAIINCDATLLREILSNQHISCILEYDFSNRTHTQIESIDLPVDFENGKAYICSFSFVPDAAPNDCIAIIDDFVMLLESKVDKKASIIITSNYDESEEIASVKCIAIK